MTKSRLRRPTSKSIATVLSPCWARPVATLALVVVLPTPPLPEVMTTTLDTGRLLNALNERSNELPNFLLSLPLPTGERVGERIHLERQESAIAVFEIGLHGATAQLGRDLFGHDVRAADGDQLRLQLLDEDARPR